MEDSESRVEGRPQAALPENKRALGKLPDERSVSLSMPSPLKKGVKAVPRAAVGLRAAPKPQPMSDKAVESHTAVRERVREGRDEHRQKVWDKLDAARQKADAKMPRLQRFSPARQEAGNDRGSEPVEADQDVSDPPDEPDDNSG